MAIAMLRSILLMISALVVTFSIEPSASQPQQHQREQATPPVWEVTTLCSIPNEDQQGVCRPPEECRAYGAINDPASLSSVGRLSFLKQVQCNATASIGLEQIAVGGVCCPRSGSYRSPTLNESLPRRMRPKSAVVHSRFGDDETCGFQTYVAKIRGGEIANIDEFPWMAMLLYEARDSSSVIHGCGGALISRNFVVTAAHCVTGREYDTKGPLKFVRLREYNVYDDPDCVIEQNFQDCSEEKFDTAPLNILVHPQYDHDGRNKHHDIALIEIESSPPYSDFLRPICLPEPELDNGATEGKKLIVSGWGRTDIFRKQLGNNALSPIKLKVVLPYVDSDTCQKVFRPQRLEIGSGQLCAGGQKAKDTCGGDSGSPLMHYDVTKGVWVLTGIVSLGVRDCGTEGIPGVYTNVREYLDWLKENARL
ncbi:CLIP domain-containing serine protease B8-like [Malaya genurostris]|uniref:CLIP domain-containing serine protease B8-like n=1 Tax=Malaya genurostris TaxID=325434 RepID=UPI0026F3E77F|nr:CLIP domain-containing serine protease B8-like [Malaya genurostris]